MNIELVPLILLMLGAFCLGLMAMYIYFVLKYGHFLAYLDATSISKLYK